MKRVGHTSKDLSVAITESHLITIPECIVHTRWARDVIEVYTGNEVKASIVDGVSSKDLGVEFVGFAEVFMHLLCINISCECSVVATLFENKGLAFLICLF